MKKRTNDTAMPHRKSYKRSEGAPSATRARTPASRVAAAAGYALVGAFGAFAQSGAFASDTLVPTNSLTTSKREWAAAVRWENDTFGGTDRFYTDGVALGISHTGPSWMDPVANWLPWGEGRRTVSYDFAQAMFTPSDKDLNPPDPNDRPYAGILALGLTLHVEKPHSYYGLKFVTGVVGPWSGAEQTQNAVHDLIGNGRSQGWDYQLHNEPIFNFAFEYRHKFQLAGQREGWSLEALPFAGGWLGNMLTQGQIGGIGRFGYNMPDDFGPTLVRGMDFMPPPKRDADHPSKSNWGFSAYGGAMANLVLRDITLDGNTFKDSPSVDKEWFVPAAGIGMTVGNRHFQASFSYIFWGKEFEGQQDYSKFGSLTFSYLF
jgi:lipid A 3-O-deacylase